MELRLSWIILIFTASGSPGGVSPLMTTRSVTTTTTEAIPKYAFYLGMEITNRVFNHSLRDPESAYYKSMYAQVSGALADVYNCSTCYTQPFYKGVAAMTFRNGSVIANSTIIFQTVFINAIVVKNLFVAEIPSSSEINGLKINSKFTEELSTPIPAALPTTGYTTTTPLTRSTSMTSKHTNTTTFSSAPTSKSSSYTSSPLTHTSTHPGRVNSTTTNPSSNTTRSHITSSTSNSQNLSSTTARPRRTEPILLPTSTAPVSVGGDSHYRGVPGWAIALLVLACIILLLLIILLIITLIRWCCAGDDKPEPEDPPEPQHTPYERTTFKEPLSTPSYSPLTPQKSPVLSPFEDPAKPKVNRTGMYVVNPET
ncbi:location of vulva defective 1 [Pygocentrus nattereri]|uniref:location of vulva defective 1 n=1 Tax=Pygocentrus nattereri TaxID=42514 RepID=UPI001890D189|nr:location of vulva defective 1 [Pygocentrus nattereri]